MNSKDFARVIKLFKKRRVVVIGDILIDRYVFGNTSRISREAPVLILNFVNEKIMPGGGGNAVNNLNALGAEVVPVSYIGDDTNGEKLLDYFNSKGITTEYILKLKSQDTTSKTRILAGGHHTTKQQVIRIDKERIFSPSQQEARMLYTMLSKACEKADAVLVSDYSMGVVDDNVINIVCDIAKRVPVCVDSRFNLKRFKNVTIATPNEEEFFALCGAKNFEDEIVFQQGKDLLKELNLKALLVTRGSSGMVLFRYGKNNKRKILINKIPIFGTDEIADVTGAGDTVASVITLCLANGIEFLPAAEIANIAGGIVVMKRGTATVSFAELKQVILSNG